MSSRYWPRESYKWYSDACTMFEYPNRAFGDTIRQLILSDDNVLDIGSGIGAGSLMVAPWCKNVIALDTDKNALQCLEASAKERGITNIETVCESWPAIGPLRPDIILAINVYPVSSTLEGLQSIYNAAVRGGFIACNAPYLPQYDPFLELENELGIEADDKICENSCYTRGALEALGAKVTCMQAEYDFGQPLDTLEEAVGFISWQIGADDSMASAIKKYIMCTYAKTGGKYLIPIRRQSCGIVFGK